MPSLTIATLRGLLDAQTPEEFVRSTVLAPVPWVFGGDAKAFAEWRDGVSRASPVPAEPFIVGSAATGYSLKARQAGRAFRPIAVGGEKPSDIDVALVSELLFTQCWNEILQADRRRELRLGQEKRDQLHQNVYFGFVSPSVLPRGAPALATLQTLKASCARAAPFRGHPVSLRIYRRDLDLHGYQTASVQTLRRELERPSP